MSQLTTHMSNTTHTLLSLVSKPRLYMFLVVLAYFYFYTDVMVLTVLGRSFYYDSIVFPEAL